MGFNKPFKVIKSEDLSSVCNVYGNNHYKELDYAIPEWNKDDKDPEWENYFTYRGEIYFLSQFMRIDKKSPFYLLDKDGNQVFDGYHGDSFFSGILIKYSDCGDAVKAYTYIS